MLETLKEHFAEFLTEDGTRPLITSNEAEGILNKGYKNPGETTVEMYYRLAITASRYLKDTPLSNTTWNIFEMFIRGWLSPASPVAANFGSFKPNGKPKGAPASCFGAVVPNSISGIGACLTETMMYSKVGGGVGAYFGEIKGITSAARWMKLFDDAALFTAQGGVRRGNFALSIPADHPDIWDVLNAKDVHAGGDLRFKLDSNIAVCITDEFMLRFFSGELEAKKIMDKVFKLRLKYGSPYITYVGNANRQAPSWYKDKGMKIKHSQLCLLPTEPVLVREDGFKRQVQIRDLVGKEVEIWNGKEWVKNASFKARGTAELFMEITINDRFKFYTTLDHQHILAGKKSGARVKAHELKLNDLLMIHPEARIREARVTGLKQIGYKFIKGINGLPAFTEPPTVYCPTVPETHAFGLANGIVTGNCNEIYQFSDINHSYICVLSSLNLAKYDEWAHVRRSGFTIPQWSIFFLDAVVEELIIRLCDPKKQPNGFVPYPTDSEIMIDSYVDRYARPGLQRALRSTIKGRALGLGTLGYHAYLMSRNVPFESPRARAINKEVHSYVGSESIKAGQLLAEWLGECYWTKGYKIRNSQLMAIAPTTTSSVLCDGVTPGIEPIAGNVYEKMGAKVNKVRKNPYLEKLLIAKGKNTPKVWNQVLNNQGSVGDLDFLTAEEKAVFKTFREIDPREIIDQTADRQNYLPWQGQSVNLYYDPQVDEQKVVDDFVHAYNRGVKGLYYVRSKTSDTNKKDAQVHLKTRTDCTWCTRTKELLDSYGIAYTEEYKPAGKVPEITFFGNYIEGGYEGLVELLEYNAFPMQEDCTACEG